MRFEVKNGENLAALLKAFPNAKVRALITRPKIDCWSFEVPELPQGTGPNAGLTALHLKPEDPCPTCGKEYQPYVILDYRCNHCLDKLKKEKGTGRNKSLPLPTPLDKKPKTTAGGGYGETSWSVPKPAVKLGNAVLEPGKTFLARVDKGINGKRVWAMFDQLSSMLGGDDETKKQIIQRWEKIERKFVGLEDPELVQIPGVIDAGKYAALVREFQGD